MSLSPSSRRGSRGSRLALSCLAACALSAAAAAPAVAGSWEQISRGAGAQGWAPFTHQSQPIAVSDTGRYGLVRSSPNNGTPGDTFVRDIVANDTKAIAVGEEQILGFNAAETLALVSKPNADNTSITLLVRPVSGAADRPIFTTALDEGQFEIDASISGDGKTVAAGVGNTLKLITVATGAVKSIAVSGLVGLGPRSLSDDGKIVAGSRNYSQGFTVINGVVAQFDHVAMVSPNGAVIVTYASTHEPGYQPDQIAVQRVSDGLKKVFPIPGGSFAPIAWVAPDGGRVVLGAYDSKAWSLNFATGKWSVFGGPYSDSLWADITGGNPWPNTVISRNGRYAGVSYPKTPSGQAAIVDLTGRDLPGTQEALSASSYINVFPPVHQCGVDGSFTATFLQPASWLPIPRRAELIVTIAGKVTFRKLFQAPILANTATDVEPTTIPFSGTAKAITIRANVVNELGKTVTTIQTVTPWCFPGEFPIP